jgi:hypothetical protein
MQGSTKSRSRTSGVPQQRRVLARARPMKTLSSIPVYHLIMAVAVKIHTLHWQMIRIRHDISSGDICPDTESAIEDV